MATDVGLLFQFLIGTLKTDVLVAAQLCIFVFQFLIGTLKTSTWRLDR